jgi:uncharacterized protein (TIGR03435 family)
MLSSSKAILFAALSLALLPPVFAQTATALPSFEVATIRANPGADPSRGEWSLPDTGAFRAKGLSLQYLIELAYGINADQVVNAPAWLNYDVFDISAKPEIGIKLSREELRPRLQSLLRERFHLVTHNELRSVPGYVLSVSKGGAKLKATDGSRSPGWRVDVRQGSVKGINWSMADLTKNIGSLLGRSVADATGITGSYDISFEYATEGQTDSNLPALFTALTESTGLRLVAGKVPVQTLVIDSVDREPTAN